MDYDNRYFDDDCMFGGCYLRPFSKFYDRIHIPLSVSICAFGAVSNIFNIIVLTRKAMRTPVNILLAGLSFSQWLLATNYLGLLAVEYYRNQCCRLPWTYPFALYRLINVNCNVIFHTVAFAHTLLIAIFRYGALKWPVQASNYLYRPELALLATILMWFIVPILCIPIFFTSQVGELEIDYLNCSLKRMYDLNYSQNSTLVKFVFWMFGIVLKLIPSFLLTLFVVALIRSLHTVERKHRFLTCNKLLKSGKNNESLTSSSRFANNIRKTYMSTSRTTRMLICILFLCIAVELPHGILNLCTGIYGENFGIRIYDYLGSFMEMLTLLYSSISFILYCTMSHDYLSTFKSLFCSCLIENSTLSGRK
ncbi:unnamed protein product [Thelazia callipaeda]|uniref:G_PROTEIN_RECEP_F1_2 domain-containing protein n=1 Tax=Thelazia callipaeda TaxID=103827 RepID=A0A0N5CR56_THECL|nr:unnamed protein product [Thelazia callipaeda]